MTNLVAQEQAQVIPERGTSIPFFNDFFEFRNDSLQFWLDVGKEGGLVKIKLGPAREMVVVTDADLFQQIFQTKSKNFPRDRQLRSTNRIDNGNTVFNADTYEEWRWRRRLLQPGFHKKELAKFGETMVAETVKLAAETDTNRPVNLTDFMKKLTMRIICLTMFSASLEETDILQESFETSSEFSFNQMTALVPTPIWLPTPMIQRTKHAVKIKYDILGRIVDDRLASGKPQGDAQQRWDMLDMLISTQLEEDEAMPGVGRAFEREDLVAEMSSLVFAGHETTAMTLMWLIQTLAHRPEIEAKLRAEIDEVLGDRPITLDDIGKMPYTHMVIQETLRLYPSVYVTLREAEEDDVLTVGDTNYHIPAGTQFLLNIRGLHQDETHWPDGDQFIPERFTAENSAGRHKFAYQPFISGPKKCIGDSFAMMEMRLVVPTLLQQLTFQPVSTDPAKEAPGFVMETEEPVMMRVEKYSG